MAALTSGPVPSKQAFWLCRDPACPAVYFSVDASVISAQEFRTVIKKIARDATP